MGLLPKRVFEKIEKLIPGALEAVVEGPGDPFGVLKAESVLPVFRHLRADREMQFDYCVSVSGVDDRKDLWVVWHLASVPREHRVTFKLRVDRQNPVAPSVTSIWKGADWHERETYDLVGIRFEGHPDLRRILLPEDWAGHPLRKDYEYPDEYQGIPLK